MGSNIDAVVSDLRSLLNQDLKSFLGDSTRVAFLNEKIDQLKETAKECKVNKDSEGKKVIEAYSELLNGIVDFNNDNKKKSIKIIEDAAESFSKAGYDIEAFKLNVLLCILYSEIEDTKNAMNRGIKALQYGSAIDPATFANYRNFKQMIFLTNFLYGNLEKIKEERLLIFLLSEKMLTINKNTKKDEYLALKNQLISVVKSKITNLIADKKYNEAIIFIEKNNFPIDAFLKEFNVLVEKFLEQPDVDLLNVMLRLCSFQSTIPYAKTILDSWKKAITPVAAALFAVDPLVIPEIYENKPFIEYLLADQGLASTFMENVVALTEALVDDPQNKDILAVFLLFSETLSSLNRSAEMATVNSLIQAALQLRKVTKQSIDYPGTIYTIFKETSGRFAPLSLIRSYYNAVFAPRDHKNDMDACNHLSQFIGNVTEIVISFPDSKLKTQVLEEIENINSILTSNYEETIMSRIRSLSLERMLASNPVALQASILGQRDPDYPIPFLIALERIILNWRFLPMFEMRRYINYQGVSTYPPSYGPYQIQTQKLKPIIWLLLFQNVFIGIFINFQHRLVKNQELQHKDLLRAVLAQINYFYELRACINEDLSFNRGSLPDFWSELINFLKKMNDMIQITGKEMEELIYTSQWRDEARPLLAKVIEFKNFCLYCNFNMPRGAIICPNCKKEVQPVVIEAPQMNLGSMQDFFSQSTSQADMSANSPAGPAASLGGIRKCPKCGGLVSADDNTCMNCQYKVPL